MFLCGSNLKTVFPDNPAKNAGRKPAFFVESLTGFAL